MTIEKLEALERAKDDPTCSADEFCERCTKLAYAQQAAFPSLLAVAKAAKAVVHPGTLPACMTEQTRYYTAATKKLEEALAQLEATP